MSLILQSSGGGQITIQEPATASNFTQTLPAATGDVMVSGNMPAFSAYNSSSQSISSATATKVILQTEAFDTASCFDNSTNYRFTPNVAGYYQINGRIRYEGTSITAANIQIYKNGSVYVIGNELTNTATQTTNGIVVSELIYLNGSTDYVELYGFIAAISPAFGRFNDAINCRFSGALVRAA